MSPSLACKLALGVLVIPSVALAIPVGSETSSTGPEVKSRATAIKVLLGNDDGWAEANLRQLYADAKATGYDVVLSAGAKNGSGLGSLDVSYGIVSGAEYNSIPDGSAEAGFNQTDPRLNYYNGTPVAAMEYGFKNLTTKFWNGAKPDLVLSGPNVGSNLGAITLLSGTVGVANYALKQGVPAIAFSGGNGTSEAWTALQPGDTAHLYSQLALTITKQIISSTPFLPSGVSLNVNFPNPSANCSTASDFKYVFTTVYPLAPTIKCSSTVTTPAEADVITSGACLVSISAMNSSKFDATPAQQTTVFNKLKPILSCADVEDHILSAIFPLSTV